MYDYDCEKDDTEPVGSCERCGTNIYADDHEDYCDQCLWWTAVAEEDANA